MQKLTEIKIIVIIAATLIMSIMIIDSTPIGTLVIVMLFANNHSRINSSNRNNNRKIR